MLSLLMWPQCRIPIQVVIIMMLELNVCGSDTLGDIDEGIPAAPNAVIDNVGRYLSVTGTVDCVATFKRGSSYEYSNWCLRGHLPYLKFLTLRYN